MSSMNGDNSDALSDHETVDGVIIKKERKTRFAFKDTDDIKLLQEVLSEDGIFVDGTKPSEQWRGIAKRLQRFMPVTAHSLRRRVKTLHETFLATERQSKAASGEQTHELYFTLLRLTARYGLYVGIDEELDEKSTLLAEYDQLLTERSESEEKKKTEKCAADKRNDEGGRVLRDAAMESLSRSGVESKPKFNVHDFLSENQRLRTLEQEERANAKRQRLDIETRQLALQEQSIAFQQKTMELMAALIEKLSK
jgi:hypothetical protein